MGQEMGNATEKSEVTRETAKRTEETAKLSNTYNWGKLHLLLIKDRSGLNKRN